MWALAEAGVKMAPSSGSTMAHMHLSRERLSPEQLAWVIEQGAREHEELLRLRAKWGEPAGRA